MNLITPAEVLDIYSYLKHLHIKIKDTEEKNKINHLLEKLKQILTSEEKLQNIQNYETEQNSSIIVDSMKARIKESVLYDEPSKKLKEVLVTIKQNFDSGLFEIVIDDLSGKEPFEVLVEELDLNLEDKIIRCSKEYEKDYFDILLEENYIETLVNILNANCDLS